jgi:GNAT superfamily N-acetyltransferase
MPPWSAMDYPAEAMARFLATCGDGASRYRVEVDGLGAGAVSIRHPWLKGPYLELLALLPPFQRRGIGAGILSWFEEAGRTLGARNLWVCASSFNDGALRFYQRHGYQPAAVLPGLVADGYEEVLLRKFPLHGAD